MAMLLAGVVLFVGVHSMGWLGVRDRAAAAMGEGPWKGVYSLVSIVGFVLLVYGYGAARQAPELVWAPPVWTRHLAFTVLLPVFPLLFAAYLPGRIKAWVGHPMLAATALWAAAHLLANGMLHDLVLFGSMLAWALITWVSYRTRVARPVPGAPATGFNDLLAIVLGLGVYGAFFGGLHVLLFGVSPLG